MRKAKKFFLGLFLVFLLLMAFSPQDNLLAKECESTTSEGLDGGFLFFKSSVVPCGRSCDVKGTDQDESASCTLCHFILLAKNIYDLLFAIVIFTSILMITIGGTIYMISSGNQDLAKTGKGLITKTLAGFAVFTLGELIVITILNFVGVKNGFVGKGDNFFEFTCDTESAFDRESSSGGGSGGEEGDNVPVGNIPVACNTYKESFNEVAGTDKNLGCLLVGIAVVESACNPSVIGDVGECGMTQAKPEVAGKTCEQLKDSKTVLAVTKEILSKNISVINGYSSTFDIGSSYSQSGTTITYKDFSGKSFVYDKGNDDLIASYNAGTGNGINSDKTKQPFYVSMDCSSPTTPAWQCPINPGGFDITQAYVQNVQFYQKSCLENNYL